MRTNMIRRTLTMSALTVAAAGGIAVATVGPATAATTDCKDDTCTVTLTRSETRDYADGAGVPTPWKVPWTLWSGSRLPSGFEGRASEYLGHGRCAAFTFPADPLGSPSIGSTTC